MKRIVHGLSAIGLALLVAVIANPEVALACNRILGNS